MLATALALCFWPAVKLQAQQAEASIGRFFDSTGWTAYRLGITRPVGSVFRLQLHGDVLRTDRSARYQIEPIDAAICETLWTFSYLMKSQPISASSDIYYTLLKMIVNIHRPDHHPNRLLHPFYVSPT